MNTVFPPPITILIICSNWFIDYVWSMTKKKRKRKKPPFVQRRSSWFQHHGQKPAKNNWSLLLLRKTPTRQTETSLHLYRQTDRYDDVCWRDPPEREKKNLNRPTAYKSTPRDPLPNEAHPSIYKAVLAPSSSPSSDWIQIGSKGGQRKEVGYDMARGGGSDERMGGSRYL